MASTSTATINRSTSSQIPSTNLETGDNEFRSSSSSSSSTSSSSSSYSLSTSLSRLYYFLQENNICRRFTLRVHKFSFQWDLVGHFMIAIFSLFPFFFTGNRYYSIIPMSVWVFYHGLFLFFSIKQANKMMMNQSLHSPPPPASPVTPVGSSSSSGGSGKGESGGSSGLGFGFFSGLSRFFFKHHSFKSIMEDFFSPKLLPVLSFSFLLVTLSLAVTGHRLGGPPLCYQSCGICLAQWENAIPLDTRKPINNADLLYRIGCGYENGKEMLAFYTMAQTSFTLFITVLIAMSICLAWRIHEDEDEERNQAENWLKQQSTYAYELRNSLNQQCGGPATSIRPEGSAAWIFYGIIAALTFTLLGWHNWYLLPPSHTATLLIILNLLTILMTTLILHLGFFGRILALYKRNYLRVEYLTTLLTNLKETEIDPWWNCRNFVLNDDLSLDYDIGGLAVSATFLIDVFVFFVLMIQVKISVICSFFSLYLFVL